MIIALAALLVVGVLAYTLFIRLKDVPPPEPVSPLAHLEDRKAAIYENLRDLQFEYRLSKLSDEDYQRTKLSLQKELAAVLSEMEETAKRLGLTTKKSAPSPARAPKPEPELAAAENTCPHCGAKFARAMKFCGECGKAMA
jgi:hypothetical protein